MMLTVFDRNMSLSLNSFILAGFADPPVWKSGFVCNSVYYLFFTVAFQGGGFETKTTYKFGMCVFLVKVLICVCARVYKLDMFVVAKKKFR